MKSSRLDTYLNAPRKALWTLAIPIMIGMGIHTMYTVVDIIFIGWLGGDAIAAVAFNMPLFFFVMGLTMGLGTGVTATVARYVGARDKINADNGAEHAVVLGLVIGIPLMLSGLLFGPQMLQGLGTPQELIPLSWSYLRIISWGLPFMIFSGFFRSILAGEGDTKFPMMVAGLGTVLNIILDPIFIFLLDMGVPGAAVATIISQIVSFSIFFYMLYVKKHSYISFKIQHFHPDMGIIKDIFRVGIPASLSMIIMSIGQGVFNRILISFSQDTVAAYQISGRIDMLVLLPIMSIGAALTTLVGMFYGANEIEKLKMIVKYGYGRSFLITVLSSLLIFILAPILVTGFTPSVGVQQIAITYLRLITLVYPVVAIGITSGRILQGFGKGIPVLAITSIRILLVSAPLASFFAFILHKPLEWVWYSMMMSTLVATAVGVVWVRRIFRQMVLVSVRQ